MLPDIFILVNKDFQRVKGMVTLDDSCQQSSAVVMMVVIVILYKLF